MPGTGTVGGEGCGGSDRAADGRDDPAVDPTIARDRAPALWDALERSRSLGALSERPLVVQILHAWSFGDAASVEGPATAGPVLDLGSGGGLPGLVLAHRWPGRPMVLLDAARRRCELLEDAVAACGLDGAVRVVCERAEVAGREPELRGRFGLVVARSFGPPPVVAECAAPFLQVGGVLVVSDPPDGGADRWPSDGLADVGLVPLQAVTEPVHLQVLQQQRACPERYPRRVGVPSKRPIYRIVGVRAES